MTESIIQFVHRITRVFIFVKRFVFRRNHAPELDDFTAAIMLWLALYLRYDKEETRRQRYKNQLQ